ALSLDCNSFAALIDPDTDRYSRATFRLNSSRAARSASAIPAVPSATTLKDCPEPSSVTAPSTFLNTRTEYFPGNTSGPCAAAGGNPSPGVPSSISEAVGYLRSHAVLWNPSPVSPSTRRIGVPDWSYTVR